jgi:hypothetical protein
MANMATRVQRAWDDLRGRLSNPDGEDIDTFRSWMTSALIEVSSKLPPLLAWSRHTHRYVLDTPSDILAIRRDAWDRFVSSLGEPPPAFDPVRLWKWAEQALWSLCVFIDPSEGCDIDESELELWWSEAEQKALYTCDMGHHFEFRRRTIGANWKPLDEWTGDSDVVPAPRTVVSKLYPDIELLGARDAHE